MSRRYNNKVERIYDRQPIRPKNEKQKKYINLIQNMDCVTAIGSAGTGKTYLPSLIAMDMLEDPRSSIEKIVIVRPNAGPGKSIGFLKGSLMDKMLPWAAPVLDAMESRLGGGQFAKEKIKNMIEYGTIELLPIEYVRGKSFNNAFIIIDEAQNLTWEETKALLTRLGLDSKLIICGDIKQTDIKEDSGLGVLQRLGAEYHVPWGEIEFTIQDCVRSDMVKYFLQLFEDAKV